MSILAMLFAPKWLLDQMRKADEEEAAAKARREALPDCEHCQGEGMVSFKHLGRGMGSTPCYHCQGLGKDIFHGKSL